MKRITHLAIFAILMCLAFGAMAQSSAVDRYFESYQGDERFTSITVSSKMFGLFVNFEMDDPAEQELVEAISKLKGLKMLAGEDVKDAKSIFKAAVKQPATNMEELMSVNDAEREFKFFITESNGKISELLMVGYEHNQVMILSLVGEIDLRQIARLSQKMNIEGFEHFKNIGNQ